MENRVPPADGAAGRRGSGRLLEVYINRKKKCSVWTVCGVSGTDRLAAGNGGLLCHLESWVGNR